MFFFYFGVKKDKEKKEEVEKMRRKEKKKKTRREHLFFFLSFVPCSKNFLMARSLLFILRCIAHHEHVELAPAKETEERITKKTSSLFFFLFEIEER